MNRRAVPDRSGLFRASASAVRGSLVLYVLADDVEGGAATGDHGVRRRPEMVAPQDPFHFGQPERSDPPGGHAFHTVDQLGQGNFRRVGDE